jgi:glyoxylase-like metal-dependent hydrolase (beta-lactamase superfamily II)
MFGRVQKPVLVADGVVRLGTDLCNWFLLDSEDGVVVVDTGFPAYRPQLEPGLGVLGRSRDDVAAVVLTHAHGDHAGSAERLRRELGVSVHVHAADEQRARTGRAKGKTEASTLPYLRHREAWVFLTHFRTSGTPEPIASLETFDDGALLPGGLRAVLTGGHTPGLCVFHHEQRGLLFVGDLLTTGNPLTGGRGPELMPRALDLSSATMLDSLSKLEALEAGSIHFGHGDTWHEGAAAAVERARAIGPT